jgi:ribosomal protein S17
VIHKTIVVLRNYEKCEKNCKEFAGLSIKIFMSSVNNEENHETHVSDVVEIIRAIIE